MMRKKTYLFAGILLFSLAWTGCERNNVRIEGKVEKGALAKISLERLDVNRSTLIDTIKCDRDGNFRIATSIEHPELFILSDSSRRIINLLLFPGDRVKVSTNLSDFDRSYRVEGSEESARLQELVQHLQLTRKIQDSLRQEALQIKDPEAPEVKDIQKAYAQSIIAQKRFSISYLMAHPGSLSSVYALYQKFGNGELILGEAQDIHYFKMVSDSVSKQHPESSLAVSLRTDIERREKEQIYADKVNSLLEMADFEETGYINLNLPDRDGNSVMLSSLKGKTILLVFWASWNENSISALLRLQSTYDRYHDKGLEVYAVSLDNNKARWMGAIDFNEFGWINVSDLAHPESEAAMKYNVGTLPTNFLINKEGQIVARDLQGRTLETWLDNLL